MGVMIRWSASFALVTSASAAYASEDGLSHYPTGVNTVLNGILPPPGKLQVYSYTQYYDVDSFAGPDGKSAIPDFKVDLKVEAPRLVYSYPVNMGNFGLSSGITLTIVSEKLRAAGLSDSKTGFGDITLEPLYLTYHNDKHNFFAYGGVDIFAPTGAYKAGRLANLGQNYWTFSPDIFLTWLPNKRTEISVAAVAEFNTTNKATGYHSGSAVNVDYSFHYAPFKTLPHLRFAAQGFYHKQVQDDKIGGAAVPGGFRGQVFAIGPQVEYDIMPRGGILFKFQREFAVENRPRGSKFWIEFTLPLS